MADNEECCRTHIPSIQIAIDEGDRSQDAQVLAPLPDEHNRELLSPSTNIGAHHQSPDIRTSSLAFHQPDGPRIPSPSTPESPHLSESGKDSQPSPTVLAQPSSDAREDDPPSPPPTPTFSVSDDVQFPSTFVLRENNSDENIQLPIVLDPNTKNLRLVDEGRTSLEDLNSKAALARDGLPLDFGKNARAVQLDIQPIHRMQDEADATDPSPFTLKPLSLTRMFGPKDIGSLIHLGGTPGIVEGLCTSTSRGITTIPPPEDAQPKPRTNAEKELEAPHLSDEKLPAIRLTAPTPSGSGGAGEAPYVPLEDRTRVYGTNVVPIQRLDTLFETIRWVPRPMLLLLVSVSIALGLDISSHTIATSKRWTQDVATLVLLIIIVLYSSIGHWLMDRRFLRLARYGEVRGVKVIRNNLEEIIDVEDLVVGDLALLYPGEIIPADGIFITGHGVRCDESMCTGDSDLIRKVSYAEMLELHNWAATKRPDHNDIHTDCFLLSGSKICEGIGKYIVVAVGQQSIRGRNIMQDPYFESEGTPLHSKVCLLAKGQGVISRGLAVSFFCAMMIKFFIQLAHGMEQSPKERGRIFLAIFVLAAALVPVVGQVVGLPLPVHFSLAFSMQRMIQDNILLRRLASCETMAYTTVVCADKTAVLTQNRMTVASGTFGIRAKFTRYPDRHAKDTNPTPESDVTADFPIGMDQFDTILPPHLQTLINESIALNSTEVYDRDPGEMIFNGSDVESALLRFVKDLKWKDVTLTRNGADILQMFPLSDNPHVTAIVIKGQTGGYRAYFKGASELLAQKSIKYIVVHQDGHHSGGGIETMAFDSASRTRIEHTITEYASQALLTVCLCYRDLVTWPPRGTRLDEHGEISFHALFQDLTLIAALGIEDPLRPGICEAVRHCGRAGIKVKMCTGDHAITARAIAQDCGILTEHGIVMEGQEFRRLDSTQKMAISPRLQVLARASGYDKQDLVQTLQELGEVVAVTGDGPDDGYALRTADVGVSLGIKGTEIAKECSDVTMIDDGLPSFIGAIKWGRWLQSTVRKILQVQLISVTSVVPVVFVSALVSGAENSVLSVSQLLWMYLVTDVFSPLSLATEPPADFLLDKKPLEKQDPLLGVDMLKMILCQSVFQAVIFLVFHFHALRFLSLDPTTPHICLARTLVFNAFVFAQLSNTVNSIWYLNPQRNTFRGLFPKASFVVTTALVLLIQVLIIFIGGEAFHVVRMTAREWAISLAVGLSPIPFGILVGYLPNKPFMTAFTLLRLLHRPRILPTVRLNTGNPSGRRTSSDAQAGPSPRSPVAPLSTRELHQGSDPEEQLPSSPVSPIAPPGLTPVGHPDSRPL